MLRDSLRSWSCLAGRFRTEVHLSAVSVTEWLWQTRGSGQLDGQLGSEKKSSCARMGWTLKISIVSSDQRWLICMTSGNWSLSIWSPTQCTLTIYYHSKSNLPYLRHLEGLQNYKDSTRRALWRQNTSFLHDFHLSIPEDITILIMLRFIKFQFSIS